jgi:SAM-dependent methyltransferase
LAPTHRSEPKGLDAYASSYEAELWRSIGFARQEQDFYAEAKARRLLEVGERHLGGLDAARALDVGCGIGLTDRFLVGRLRHLRGTDLAPTMLDRARETNPAVRYDLCEPQLLPYPDEQFDLVFAICVLHHVVPPERPAFVGELHRVTRPGGLVVAFEHNPWNPLTRLVVRNCSFDEDVELLARRELRRLLAAAELVIAETGFLLFTPWRRRLFARLDRALAPLPLGAQYFVAAKRASSA